MEIFSIIDDWYISFKYNDKPITFINHIIQKNLSYISFNTLNWNHFVTTQHYHYTVQPGTSGRTDTTKITLLDTGQMRTWPKISLYERTNTHTLQSLSSIITQIVHIFQIPLKVKDVYSHKSYNTYPCIIYYRFPWPRTSWTFFPVVTGILLYFFFSCAFTRYCNLLIFLIRKSHLTCSCHRLIFTTTSASSYLLLRYL